MPEILNLFPKIFYISFSANYTINNIFKNKGNNNHVNEDDVSYNNNDQRIPLNIINNADDSPYERMDLSFGFLFFGKIYDSLYVNPNGALHFNNWVDCIYFCTNPFNTSLYYASTIGGIFGDLNPSSNFFKTNNLKTNITYYLSKSESYYDIYFKNIPYYGVDINKGTTSFRFILHKDGSVIILYENFR